MGQPSLVDSLLPEKLGRNARLERIGREIDWGRFAVLVDNVFPVPEVGPGYLPLTMVNNLLLQQWHILSNNRIEEALDDHISFLRFVGPGLEHDMPDYSTISGFRTELARRCLSGQDLKIQ